MTRISPIETLLRIKKTRLDVARSRLGTARDAAQTMQSEASFALTQSDRSTNSADAYLGEQLLRVKLLSVGGSLFASLALGAKAMKTTAELDRTKAQRKEILAHRATQALESASLVYAKTSLKTDAFDAFARTLAIKQQNAALDREEEAYEPIAKARKNG